MWPVILPAFDQADCRGSMIAADLELLTFLNGLIALERRGILFRIVWISIFPVLLTGFQERRLSMDPKELKKILAGLGIASLVSAVGVTVPGALHAASG